MIAWYWQRNLRAQFILVVIIFTAIDGGLCWDWDWEGVDTNGFAIIGIDIIICGGIYIIIYLADAAAGDGSGGWRQEGGRRRITGVHWIRIRIVIWVRVWVRRCCCLGATDGSISGGGCKSIRDGHGHGSCGGEGRGRARE